jgi:hypothetical protein
MAEIKINSPPPHKSNRSGLIIYTERNSPGPHHKKFFRKLLKVTPLPANWYCQTSMCWNLNKKSNWYSNSLNITANANFINGNNF